MSWIEGAARQLYDESISRLTVDNTFGTHQDPSWEDLHEEQKAEWRAKADANSLPNILEKIKNEPEPDEDEGYPPVGTPERALILAIDVDSFTVIAHTGRFLHAEICESGHVDSNELAIEHGDIDLAPGYYVFEGTGYWEHRDWETNFVDDYGLHGTWRRARRSDFVEFNVEWPIAEEPVND